jgi:hypothetical protein
MDGYVLESEQNEPEKQPDRAENSADGEHEDSPRHYNVERV